MFVLHNLVQIAILEQRVVFFNAFIGLGGFFVVGFFL